MQWPLHHGLMIEADPRSEKKKATNSSAVSGRSEISLPPSVARGGRSASTYHSGALNDSSARKGLRYTMTMSY